MDVMSDSQARQIFALAGLDIDPVKDLPIPWTAPVTNAGRPNFTSVSLERAQHCDRERLCGVCGKPLAYWVAFLGTATTAEGGMFMDPPMHPDCARASLTLCPHIAQGRPTTTLAANGRTGSRVPVSGYVLWITRGWRAATRGNMISFFPAPAKTVETYRYDSTTGKLTLHHGK